MILPLLLLSFSLLSFASSSDPQCAFAAETQSNVHDFSYTGSVQTFTASYSGQYKIECYGASGGIDNSNTSAGGGYAEGIITLSKGDVLNVYVGGEGVNGTSKLVLEDDGTVKCTENIIANDEKTIIAKAGDKWDTVSDCYDAISRVPTVSAGGFNGGGNVGPSGSSGGGGGASDVRLNGTSLSDRIIVAGGAGGSGNHSQGGAGGGEESTSYKCGLGNDEAAMIATQSSGYSLGIGETPSHDGGGGGGGYYGGYATKSCDDGGAGGSGYIGGVTNGTTKSDVNHGNGKIRITGMYGRILLDANGGVFQKWKDESNLEARYTNPDPMPYGYDGENAKINPLPVYNENIFLGFYTEKSGGTKIVNNDGTLANDGTYTKDDSWILTSDIKLYAHWKKKIRLNFNMLLPDGSEPYQTSGAGTFQYSLDNGSTWSDDVSNEWTGEETDLYAYEDDVIEFRNIKTATGLHLSNVKAMDSYWNEKTDSTKYWDVDSNNGIYSLILVNDMPDSSNGKGTCLEINIITSWNSYKISFDSNGGTGSMDPIEVEYPDTKTLPSCSFNHYGYKFTGWNTDENGNGTSYADNASISKLSSDDGEEIVMYAQWESKTWTVTIPTSVSWKRMDIGKIDAECSYDVSVGGEFDGKIEVGASYQSPVLSDSLGSDPIRANASSSSNALSFSTVGTKTDSVELSGTASRISEWNGNIMYGAENLAPYDSSGSQVKITTSVNPAQVFKYLDVNYIVDGHKYCGNDSIDSNDGPGIIGRFDLTVDDVPLAVNLRDTNPFLASGLEYRVSNVYSLDSDYKFVGVSSGSDPLVGMTRMDRDTIVELVFEKKNGED